MSIEPVVDNTASNPNIPQAEASDPTASAWVTANAGSGKTKVLIDRVARLLLGHGDGPAPDPSRILCLTFTKAAAANMQNKLFAQLGSWALMEDEALRQELRKLGADGAADLKGARRLFAQALETPGGLKIQTIHAFCESLLRRFPLEAGLSPHFAQIDDAEAATMQAEALDRVLARAAGGDDPALAKAADRVIHEGQEFGIRKLVPEIVGKRAAFEGEVSTLIAAMQAALGVAAGDTEDAALVEFFTETPVADIKALAAAFRRGGAREQKSAEAMEPLLQGDLMRDWMQALALAVLTQKGEPKKIGKGFPTKALAEAHPDLADRIARFQDRLTELQARLTALGAADRSRHMIVFAKAILEEVDTLKNATDGPDFDDLIRRAGKLLGDSAASAWVRYKLDGGVDHILVDEAQDTSPEQWKVISAIAEEFFAGAGARPDMNRTLFVVGDEKQSIFSFQGAVPEELDRVRERFRELVGGTGTALREPKLLHSFRSAPAVLELVDKVFANPLAAQGLNAENESPEHMAFRAAAPGRVEFWPPIGKLEAEDPPDWWEPVDTPSQEAPELRLARGVVERIAEWLAPASEARLRGRRIRAGDILVLVRTRGSFAEALIRLLKGRGLPVAGKDRMRLNEQLVVRDLMALARFALLTDDDLTLATVLRSPLIGLSEEALFTLANGRKGRLWSALHARREEADYAQAWAMLDDMQDRADYLRPYDFLERILTFHGGRGRLLDRLGVQAADPIDELLAQALDFETRGIPTLQGFIARIEESTVEIKREMEQGRDEIRVMTVHGSKGLEANIVFMPDICGMPKASGDERIFPMEGGPVWAPSAGTAPAPVRAMKEARRARDLEEYRRLLYVGMTRARDRLILCGWHGKEADKEDQVSDNSWAALVREAFGAGAVEGPTPLLNAAKEPVIAQIFENDGDEKPEEDGQGEDILTPLAMEAALLRPPPAEESAPVPVAPSRVGAGDAEPFAPMPQPSENEDAEPPLSSAERGTALHLLLERLAGIAPQDRESVARGMLEAAEPEVIAPALAVLENPDFAWMFGPGSMAEVPVQGPVSALGGRPILGTIDRLVVADDIVHVVDFKSGRPPAGIPLPYLRQLALYRAALTDIFPGREVAAHLVWIDANRAERAEATALDGAMAGMLADGSLDMPASGG